MVTVQPFAATGLQEHYDNYWNEVNTLKKRDKGVATMQQIGITSAEQKMIDDMYTLSNQLVPLEDEAMKNVQNGKKEIALDYVYGIEYNDSISKINTMKEQFLSAFRKISLGNFVHLSLDNHDGTQHLKTNKEHITQLHNTDDRECQYHLYANLINILF